MSFLLTTNLYANEQNSEFNPSAVRGFTANELSGTVYDSVTRLPLEGVTVQLLFDGSLVNSEWLDAEIGGPSSQNVDLNGEYNFVINASAPSGIYTINLINLLPSLSQVNVPLFSVDFININPPPHYPNREYQIRNHTEFLQLIHL